MEDKGVEILKAIVEFSIVLYLGRELKHHLSLGSTTHVFVNFPPKRVSLWMKRGRQKKLL